MIKKIYKLSFAVGLILLFQLQLFSYLIWYLTNNGIINGTIDKYLLLKSSLMVIPLLFILYSLYGLLDKRKDN